MPVERLRQQLANDINLYPELASKRKATPEIITISSTATTNSAPSAPARPATKHGPIRYVLSSDEDDAEDQEDELDASSPESVEILASENRPKNVLPSITAPKRPFGSGIPIHVPSNRDRQPMPGNYNSRRKQDDDETLILPPTTPYDNLYASPEETEKALRDLMSGGMNEDAEVELRPEDAFVEGFKEGITLLPHQILGRTWMRDREDLTKKRTGGILADDMGLGKTIQTLTRIVEGRARKSDKEDGWAATTLVVCPLALVGQWADEIIKMTKGLVAVKHQGTSRTDDPAMLRKAHIVITTYDTLKSEYESYSGSAKDESGSKAKTKVKTKTKKTEADSDDEGSSGEHFGRTLAKDKEKKAKAKKCALFQVRWWRIVLDEAHNIKNQKTKGAIACYALESKFKWCLTGTPMQNNVTELYSLLKFLRIKPLSHWDTFKSQIADPVNRGRGAGAAMKRLQVVLKAIMLRRRKDQSLNGRILIELPKRNVTVISCPFDTNEKVFYDALENKMDSVIKKLMGEEGKNKYISVLVLLLRLRQACNHPMLVNKDYKADMEAIEPKSAPKGTNDGGADADDLANAFGQLGVTRKCQLCTIEIEGDNCGTGEWKAYCLQCVPLAKQAKKGDSERPASAKIRMILKLLAEVDERSGGKEKTIIFSQFTSMLDLLEPFLKEEGIRFVRYDGSMSTDARERSLEAIKSNPATRVILISFKAGSTGLNLTACNNVILVDLWWNPALEDQAFDRAHRFGQTRDVNIFKLKIDNTVEDRILALQDKKRILAAAALSGDKIKNMRLGMDDLLALFRPGGRDEDEED